MLQGKKILIVSHYDDDSNISIESYIYTSARAMLAAGAKLWLAYNGKIFDIDSCRTMFDGIFTIDEIPDIPFDLVIIHKILDTKILRKFLLKYSSKAAIFIHDHEYYCPRQWKYFPFTHTPCQLNYNFLRCAFCGMAKRPSSWKTGIIGELGDKFINFQDRLDLLRRFPHVVVISQVMRDTLLCNNFSLETLHVIQPFILQPDKTSKPANVDAPLILFAGDLLFPNGCDIFIDTISQLKHNFRAKIIGDGKQLKNLKRLAEAKAVSDKIQFCGKLTHAEYRKTLLEADILLYPTRWQVPFPMPVVEAAANEIPCVAFNIGSI
ncbi:MAG: glycosyltransferase family 4 protein, partial [Victivallales bacterium]|nr:glycosyltransferase family 4 protein [Victivallales bacterium]